VFARRVALVSSGAVVLASGLMFALGISCTHDRPAEADAIVAPNPDVAQITDAQQQPVTVLVNGVDEPADLLCLGTDRPDVGLIYPAETGTDTGTDTGTSDDAMADADDGSTADTSLDLDSATDATGGDPPPGTVVEEQVELIGFGTGGADKLGGQTIDVYYSNSFKTAPNVTVVSDDAGMFKVPLPFGVRVGYHVRKSTKLGDYFGLDDIHVPLPPITVTRWQGLTLERQDTLALAITGQKGYAIKPGTGIIAGRVLDCQRRYMQHARLVLVDYTDGTPVELPFVKCGTGLCLAYLNDAELPDIGRTATSRSSLFALIDVPSARKLRLVAKGIKDPGGPEIDVAWRNLEVQEFGIATHFLEPNNLKTP